MPTRAPIHRDRVLGTVGSTVVAGGGLLAGVTPLGEVAIDLPLLHELRALPALSVSVLYAGLAMLLLAWWRVGVSVRADAGPSGRELATTAAWWAAPFAVITPIFSGDVHSYLAQGAMTMAGLDAYRVGPSALGGPLTVNVPEIWQHTPAPYGPVFLRLAATVTALTGGGVWAGIIGMRVLALLGVGLLAWSVPRLAGLCGVPPTAAMWLGVLNPLVLLHLVADAHNEAVMLGLMCVGLLLALRRRPVLGIILITLAALVKAPAVVALAFVVPVWARHLAGRRGRLLRAARRTVLVAAVTGLAVTAATRSGIGWVRALDTPTHAHTWMSITTDLGWAAGSLLHRLNGLAVEHTIRAFWLAGLVLAAGVNLVLWRRVARIGPVAALGLGLAALVLTGPVVHPWYLLWALVPLAAAARGAGTRRAVAVGTVVLVLVVLPGGVQPGLSAALGAVLGVSAVLVATMVARRRSRQRRWTRPTDEPFRPGGPGAVHVRPTV
ncbi:polyprenol phosphomannose-dependent alpha 1,6 mannosyltransferase MptB [Micromonospora eburnea]|uniref:polyprenol phosphomannose-dependent alpha 1,6 mannosyltransferase MptB n=1 Tax=Micromonospora eburnea TaxID=227316 RepID=UPI001ABF3C3C|nr:polyprenol phosphomannose-dependent alpha 1,6 mannosyltransferase MptB [Micromonospora eburnea]